MKRILLLCLTAVFTLVSGELWAQERTISGKVTSVEDGSTLPGVNVVLKGTTIGVVTDSNGGYTLSVPQEGGTLVFTFIGLASKEVEIGTQSTINVEMSQDVNQLTEVVVTALGIEKSPKQIGYAVETVKSEELTQARATNVAQALSGKVAGLRVNTIGNGVNPATRITLRGNRSFLGNNQALVVIDGVQVPQDAINYLNPNDIESVNTLKGANAAALYGSDAANGALIITTKKGTKQAPTVTYSHTTTWENVSFLPSFQDRFGAGTEAYSRVYIPFENQQYGPEFDGSERILGRVQEDGTYQLGRYSALEDERWKVWDTGVTGQNDISLAAGDEKASFRISLQDIKSTGVVPGDENRRTTGRMSATKTLNKFKAGFNLTYSLRQTERTNSDFYNNALNTAANVPLSKMANWEPYTIGGKMNPANPNNYFNDYFPNPFYDKDLNRREQRYSMVQGSVDLGYEFTDWLSATYRVGITNEAIDLRDTEAKFAYNSFAKATGKYIATQTEDGGVRDLIGYNNRLNTDFIITAKKTFGDISTNLVLGNNIQEDKNNGIDVNGNALVIDGLYNLGNRVGEIGGGQNKSTQRKIGVYGELTLGYKDWVYLSVSGRNDWTSLLSEANRSFFYPGANLAVNISDMFPAIVDNSVLSHAKVTVSASKVGQITVGPYALQTPLFAGNGFPYGSTAGFTKSNAIFDPELEPEFTTSFEIGGELTFLDEKIGLDLAYYKQETSNQTVQIDVARSTGYTRALVNAGTMENKGYEVTLRVTPINNPDGIKVDANLNYAFQESLVTELYQGLTSINVSNYFSLTTDASLGQSIAEINQPFPIIKTVGYLRDPQGRVVVDRNSGYPIKSTSLINMGQGNPKHTLGLSFGVSYKGLRLSALAEYRGGYVLYHGLASTMWFTGSAETTAIYGRERFVFPNSVYEDENGVYVPNTDITVRDGGLGAWDSNLRTFGENFVTSGDFWKLRELSVSYEIPKSILSNTRFIKAASVALVGRNLLTLLPESNKYTDPEFANSTSNAVGLNDTFNTPPTRTYGFNVQLTF